MDYVGGDHQTADQGFVWMFCWRSKSIGCTPAVTQKAPLQLRCTAC